MALTSGPNLGILVNGALGEAHYAELMRQWRALDALIMPSVKSRIATLPTSGNTDGDRYIFTGDNRIARWTTSLSSAQWEYFTPKAGWETYSVADDKKYRYTPAGGWAEVVAGGGGGDGGFDNPMTAIGDLIVGSTAGAPTRLGKGTAGQVLTVNAGGTLEWATPTGGGGGGPAVEVYQTVAPNGSGTLDISAIGTTIWGVSLTRNATSVTLPSGFTGAKGLSLILTQDSTGGRTMAWPASVTWNGGVAPTLSTAPNARDLVSLLSVDGGVSWIGLPVISAAGGGGGGGDFKKDGTVRMTGALNEAAMATLPSSANLAIQGGASNSVFVTGSADIANLGDGAVGYRRLLTFLGTMKLKQNNFVLRLPGFADITTAYGDWAEFVYTESGVWQCIWYNRNDGGQVGPVTFAPFTLATLPPAANFPNAIITVTNATGGAKVCMSNGTNWCLLNTATVVS